MFDSIWSFIRRHRRKFIAAGVVCGGAVLLVRYAKKKLLEYQEKEAAECLAQIRRQYHFDSNQRNCNTTVLSLIPQLRETICQLLDSDSLTSQLKAKPANKVELWEELKILSFTRAIVTVYSSALLTVFLRVQLNILGGYMHRDATAGRMLDAIATADVQKEYLNKVQYLFDEGLRQLIITIRKAAESVISGISLKDNISSADIRQIVLKVREIVEGSHENGSSPSTSFSKFLLPPPGYYYPQDRNLTTHESTMQKLESETRDIVGSSDFNMLMTSCLDTGFQWMDCRVAEHFRPASTTNGIVSLAEVSVPMAKVIPAVNGLVNTMLINPPNPLIQELLLKEQVRDFAVNIYDAFCA